MAKTTKKTGKKRRTKNKPSVQVLARQEPEDQVADPEGPIIDVPTSMPRPSSASSVPALRRPAGVQRTGALQRFLAEMGRYPILTQEQERELTLKAFRDRDPVAGKKLVVHNLRLVVKMAYRYRQTWTSVLDLIQEGNLGLVEAVRRYDPFRGARFSTYATFWIRAYILRYLLEHTRLVRISRSRVGRKLFFQLSKERERLRAQGIEPETKLLAANLGVDESELAEVVQYMDQPEVRLDAPLGTDDDTQGTLLDGLEDHSPSPEAETIRNVFSEDVAEALDSFARSITDEREKAIWAKHLLSEDPKSLSELGKNFGVTKQRMGQIVNNLRKRLRVHLLDTLGPDIELGFDFGSE